MIDINTIENDLLEIPSIINQDEILKQPENQLSKEQITTIDFIIKISKDVLDTLGVGFIEGIYHKALLVDLYKTNFIIETKKIIPICYKNINVGYVESDIVINTEHNIYILELKSLDRNVSQREILQTQKYIKFIENPNNKSIIGIIINFNQKNKNIEHQIV